MDVGRNASPSAPDQLAFANPLADFHQRLGRAAHVLQQGDTHLLGRRHANDGFLAAELFAVAQLDSTSNLK
jgi:hypothetical protein